MICQLCPRRCRAKRDLNTGAGTCGMPASPVVARAGLHFYEEPAISGTRGSGCVFFSGCVLNCVFCQNWEISAKRFGKIISEARLRTIFIELVNQGAHNINLVNPTHFTHAILNTLQEPLPVPVVWNSGGYERPEILRALDGKVDIFLPDFKYADSLLSTRYSEADDYPSITQKAIREMAQISGPCQFNADGLLLRGTIIRHLLLPGGLLNAKRVMDWVKETFPNGEVYFSLMGQYFPAGEASRYPELNRRVRTSEYRAAAEYMMNLDLPGYVQDLSSATSEYVPVFDLSGV